ncbi:hypothetical protein QF117_20220 [Vibrio sp. YMD68]|uniref:hypothetical protein n=1 Tax=Vibrio sp. YMD68 TaxID=3042300 RepID=UPI00249A35BA|nr:hypothetical protein [Vibrio sp. YMD68]WGW00177.1 hypothetical protein QF117_20220 [Vibrio sp. YMD68]
MPRKTLFTLSERETLTAFPQEHHDLVRDNQVGFMTELNVAIQPLSAMSIRGRDDTR